MGRLFRLVALLVLPVAVLASFVAPGAETGGGADIPLRVPMIRPGDWIIFIENGAYVRHTAVRIEETIEDCVVYYTVDVASFDGDLLGQYERSYSRNQEMDAAAELREQYGRLGIVGEKRRVEIADKPLNVVVFTLPDPVNVEIWLTDEAGILGTVKMAGRGGDGPDLETIGFGGAGQP